MVNFIKKQYVQLLLLGFVVLSGSLVWLKTDYSEDQKLTATLFVFTISLLVGVFNNSLNDKQTIMQLLNKEQLQDFKSEILDAIKTSSNNLESSLTAKIDKVESSLTAKIDKVESSLTAKIESVDIHQSKTSESNKQTLSDQIKELKAKVDVIDSKVNSLDKNLTSLTRVLVEKEIIKPF